VFLVTRIKDQNGTLYIIALGDRGPTQPVSQKSSKAKLQDKKRKLKMTDLK